MSISDELINEIEKRHTSPRNLVTSYTLLWIISHVLLLSLCFDTSARENNLVSAIFIAQT